MKLNNFIGLIIALFFTISMFLYFILNTSYHNSIQAKYYYVLSDYENAYAYADLAYKQERYNLMAYTVREQSSRALKLVKYIKQAKDYYEKINVISIKPVLTIADKSRMRIYSRIVVEGYDDLTWTIITDENLIKEAKRLRDEFDKLLQELSKDIL